MDFIIEKNVPLIKINKVGSRGLKYPFREMEVGDSFAFKIVNKEEKRAIMQKVNTSAYYYGKRNKKKFVCRSLENEVRVWRIE
jgi:hypothetical protein